MDNIRSGLNSIATKVENEVKTKGQSIIDSVEDGIDNLDDKPVPVFPTGKQFAIGLTGGSISGAIVGRVSKSASIVIGSSLVVITLANAYGLLDDFDHNSFSRDIRDARRQLDRELRRSHLPSTNQVQEFFKKNKTMSYSGAGAFIASAAYFFK